MAKAKEKKAKEEAGPQEGLAGQASARMQDASSAAGRKRRSCASRVRRGCAINSTNAPATQAVRCARWPRRSAQRRRVRQRGQRRHAAADG